MNIRWLRGLASAAPMSSAEFDAALRREVETNGKIIRKPGLKVD